MFKNRKIDDSKTGKGKKKRKVKVKGKEKTGVYPPTTVKKQLTIAYVKLTKGKARATQS